MIEIHGLSKFYGDNEIFRDLNLHFNEGEFVSILGPSGCGKSTLISIIAGLESATTGKVMVAGDEVKDTDTDRMMVFQNAALFPWLDVYQNVAFGLKNICQDGDEISERVNPMLKKVHLYQYKDYYPHQLSGGMKQRAAIARSLVMNPAVLLMDEPFSALDEHTRLLLADELQQLWIAERITVVFVTHNIREAVKLSTKVVMLGTKPGRVIAELNIDLGYPRQMDNPEFFLKERLLYEKLKGEMEKVAREELGDEYCFEKGRIPYEYHHTLGGGI